MERIPITDIRQLNGNAENFAKQVSDMIAGYNSQHPNSFEMLPKSSSVILDHFRRGWSAVIVDQSEVGEEVLFHGSLYPNFENGEEKFLECQVVECGSWIVNPEFRGQGLGNHGVNELIKLGRTIWDPVLFIATNKRISAFKVSEKSGLASIDFKDFPYLTYLTCTCEHCSERFGFSCPFRRQTPEVVVYEDGKIDCTLVVSDRILAEKFEERCREIHGLNALAPGEIITPERMAQARDFFESLKAK